jgi:uncharacterized protein (DUF2141 family)
MKLQPFSRLTLGTMAFVFFICSSQSSWAQKLDLKLQVTNVKSAKGDILVAVYDSEDSYQIIDRAIEKFVISAESPGITIELSLQKNEYAIVLLHDENSNKVCDVNFFGIPKEGVGFSNGARPVFSAPAFNDVKFRLNQSMTTTIELIY